jgi:protein-S-isoprenylcysteine O-methyltransferase Ste14
MASLGKSLMHNVGVLLVGFGLAVLGTRVDTFLGMRRLRVPFAPAAAWLLLASGFLLRVWATFHFYEQHLKVISLVPQQRLITSGPYRFSRNPLYLGGNVFIFFGAALALRSPSALLGTLLHLPLVDRMIRREERQLQQAFGDEWTRYSRRVRRWM